MKRKFYMAGVSGRHRAKYASACPFWLLSVTDIKPRRGIPKWLQPFLTGRSILWDPGTFAQFAISYQFYRRFIDEYVRTHDEYLQYDEIGDPEATAWYLQDMKRRGYNPIPVLQPGGPAQLLEEPRVAIGGVVPMSDTEKVAYLDRLFFESGIQPGRVHLLGVTKRKYFERYPAASGDSTTWIPRSNEKKPSMGVEDYGEKEIELKC